MTFKSSWLQGVQLGAQRFAAGIDVGSQAVRLVVVAVIVGFLIVHVALALLVPKTLWAMVAGGPRIGKLGHSDERHVQHGHTA